MSGSTWRQALTVTFAAPSMLAAPQDEPTSGMDPYSRRWVRGSSLTAYIRTADAEALDRG